MWPKRWTRAGYTASEGGLAGYAASDWGGDCAADGSITLQPDESKACSISNDDQPATLTLSKLVANDDGGTAVAGDFQAYIDSDPVAWGVAQSLDAGSYTASEGGLAGYTASDWGGDCAADGSIILQPGDVKGCSISNDDQPATLTLSKLVANDDGGTAVAGDFQAYIDSDPVAWGVAQSLDAGSDTASEDGLAGYTASDWGGDCAADGSIILQPGDVKSCSISNDDQPATLTLTKVVVNDDGGTAAAGDFQAYIDSDPVAWGVAQSLDAAVDTASEDGLAGYAASDWGGDCAADGSITLQPGESKACSISNDDQPATLTLTKVVVNDDGGTAAAGDFQAYIDSDPVAWGVAQSLDAALLRQ